MSKECDEVRKDLDAFTDRELEAARQTVIEEHFKHCQPCLRLYQMIVGVKSRVKRLTGRAAAPAHLRAQVLSALDREVAQPRSRWIGERWLSWLPAPALAVALVVAIALVVTGPGTSEAYNFTEIARKACHRLAKGEVCPEAIGSEIYQAKLRQSGLPGEPKLASINLNCEGCCFGLEVGHPVAHYLFRDAEGKAISLVMWRRLTPGDRIAGRPQQYHGRDYFLANESGACLVLWQEGEVFCSVFGSDSDSRLLQLASDLRS